MKARVLAILKPIMAPKGFKQDELESFSELIGRNLTEQSTEDDIKKAIDGFMPYAELMQRIGNRYATGIEAKYKGFLSAEDVEKAKQTALDELRKKLEAEKPKPKSDEKQQPSMEELMASMQKQQADMYAKMTTQMAAQIQSGIDAALKPFNEARTREQLNSMLKNDERLKNVPDTFRDKYSLDKAEDFEETVGRIQNDYAKLKQEILRSGEFAEAPKGGKGGNEKDETIAYLNNFGKKPEQ